MKTLRITNGRIIDPANNRDEVADLFIADGKIADPSTLDLRPSTTLDAKGLTPGFHGFHVLSGVVINIVMLIMTLMDKFEQRGHYLMIEKAGLYWHFVDLVWVFVFLCFYLI